MFGSQNISKKNIKKNNFLMIDCTIENTQKKLNIIN